MPQKAWNAKRERQYEHIKEGLKEHGRSEDLAEEIAARTVNKERARSGEARTKLAPISKLTMRDANGTDRPIESSSRVEVASAPTQTTNTARSMDVGCPVAARANHRAPVGVVVRRSRSGQAEEPFAPVTEHPS